MLALVGAGGAVAAGQITSGQIQNNTITSYDIKDRTIQTRDLTPNNFGRFTATENVVTATTPVSSDPAHSGARVVEVAASGETPLVTIVLDEGTWQLDGTAQFFHIDGPAPSGSDLGIVAVSGLQDGFARAWTADVPDGGDNAAQTSFSGTIKITANDTPVTLTGSFTGSNSGEAGASVQATQFVYVPQ